MTLAGSNEAQGRDIREWHTALEQASVRRCKSRAEAQAGEDENGDAPGARHVALQPASMIIIPNKLMMWVWTCT
jgi:hypothetical protein